MIQGLIAASSSSDHTTLVVAILGTLGVVITALATYAATRYAGKKSAEAAQDTTKVTEKQVDFTALDGIVRNLQAEASRLGDRVKDLEVSDKDKQSRIDALEAQVRVSDTKYRVAITYVRDIIAWTKLALNSDRTPPTAPIEIAADLFK